jgi:hypothetical protein
LLLERNISQLNIFYSIRKFRFFAPLEGLNQNVDEEEKKKKVVFDKQPEELL